MICVGTVLGNVGHGTEIDDGCLWILTGIDLSRFSVTVLVTEIWHPVDLTADVWTHSD